MHSRDEWQKQDGLIPTRIVLHFKAFRLKRYWHTLSSTRKNSPKWSYIGTSHARFSSTSPSSRGCTCFLCTLDHGEQIKTKARRRRRAVGHCDLSVRHLLHVLPPAAWKGEIGWTAMDLACSRVTDTAAYNLPIPITCAGLFTRRIFPPDFNRGTGNTVCA